MSTKTDGNPEQTNEIARFCADRNKAVWSLDPKKLITFMRKWEYPQDIIE